jgi:virulence-associated protein VagC
MKAQVKSQGLLIPKKFLRGIQSAEIRWENSHIIIEPTKVKDDPVYGLGKNPGRSEAKPENRITLTGKEWNRFMKVMENPPCPNKALLELAKKPGRSGLKTVSEDHDQYLYGKG